MNSQNENKNEGAVSLDGLGWCPECGAKTFVDTHCVAGDHPELTMDLDFCTVCDWSGNERKKMDGQNDNKKEGSVSRRYVFGYCGHKGRNASKDRGGPCGECGMSATDRGHNAMIQIGYINNAKAALENLHMVFAQDYPGHAIEILGAIGCLKSWAAGIRKESKQ